MVNFCRFTPGLCPATFLNSNLRTLKPKSKFIIYINHTCPATQIFIYANCIASQHLVSFCSNSAFARFRSSYSGVAEAVSFLGCYILSTGTKLGRFKGKRCSHIYGQSI